MDRIVEHVNSYDNLNDPDSDSELNPEQLLNEWLGELDNLTVGLESISSCRTLKPLNPEISAPRIDSYRFSMANLEDSQDVDLDAILGELCALETQCDEDIDHAKVKRSSQSGDYSRQQIQHQSRSHSRSSSEGNRCLKLDPGESELMLKNDSNGGGTTGTTGTSSIRTDSPDNDSAFSDTVSMLSSESSASSSIGVGGHKQNFTLHLTGGTNIVGSQDTATRVKAEKIRMALEKMKEAAVKKLFIKAFTVDGSTKSLLVDEKMTCGYVTRLLADKNHIQMDPKWAIVEHLPELYMERVYEDHELLVENLMLWTRDSKNKIIFMERPDKVQMFAQPETFLLSPTDKSIRDNEYYDDHARMILLEEFFSSNANTIPEVEGNLYLKSDTKKGWKKYHFVLRASGLYYWPKEKVTRNARELICLATFDVNQIYYGVGWRKKYKAPTDYCFGIKHPRLQQPKSTKYIKFLCADDAVTLEKWMVGMKIAKYGCQLMENYRLLVDDLAQDDLDMLAHARSCSVNSIAMQTTTPATTPTSFPHQLMTTTNHQQTQQNNSIYGSVGGGGPPSEASSGRHSRASSSSSSGCMSDGALSSSENAFDSEFPTGTIKRKPSMKPSLPLTSITRQLKEVGEIRDNVDDDNDENNQLSPGSRGSDNTTYTTNTGTLTRRHSRRKSSSSSNDDTLKRHHLHHYHHHHNHHAVLRSSMESIKSGNIVTSSLSPTSSTTTTPSSPPPPPIYESGSHGVAAINNYQHSSASIFNKRASSQTTVVTTNGTISMDASITSLPPPPADPPQYTQHNHLLYTEEPLPPPPPPELFRSNLSLDSLPPPPEPGELPVYHTNSNDCSLSGSQLSLISLPPPPPPSSASVMATNCDTLKRNNKINSAVNALLLNSKNCRSSGSGSSSTDITPTQSRVGTPCFSPSGSVTLCRTPTYATSPIFFNSISTSPPSSNVVAQNDDVDDDGGVIINNNIPSHHHHHHHHHQHQHQQQQQQQQQQQGLRSSLRQSSSSSLPRQSTSIYSIASSSSNGSGSIPPSLTQASSPPPYLAKNSPQMQRKVCFDDDVSMNSPKKTLKKISFNLPPSGVVTDNVALLPPPPVPKKPSPPKRSEKTKLTSPKKLANSASAPPTDFLKDLQRVMRKKWQVAQKCKLEPATTPHEVLGFRDPPCLTVPDYRETNVSNWVQEHYGPGGLVDNLYENVYPTESTSSPRVVIEQVIRRPPSTGSCSTTTSSSIRLKRKPPPPPLRSETTQLTTNNVVTVTTATTPPPKLY